MPAPRPFRPATPFAALLVAVAAAIPGTAPAISPSADADSTIVSSSIGPLRVTTLARGLDHPWSLAFLNDGRWLIAERRGRLRAFDPATRTLSAPIGGLPEVWAHGQG